MLGDLFRAVGNFVLLPVEIVRDAAKAAVMEDKKEESHTKRRLLQFGQCVDNAWVYVESALDPNKK